MDSSILSTATFAILMVNVLMLIFVMLQVSQQSVIIRKMISENNTENERVKRIREIQKIVRRIYKNVFEGYTNARGQPRMTTDFLASYSTMESELESLVNHLNDRQLSAFVEQGIMPEAPSATGDWVAQLGKKTKLIKHIHSRLYELLEEIEILEEM